MRSERPRTTLLYLPHLKLGGAEISMLRLARGLAARGVEVAIAVHSADEIARTLAGVVALVDLQAGRTLSAVRRLAAVLRERRPDVLISALTHSNIVAVLAARMAGVPTRVVVTEHAPLALMATLDTSRRYRLTCALMPWAYRLAHAVVAVSQGVFDDVRSLLHRSTRSRLHVIFNPVLEADWQARSREPVDDEWFQPDQAPVVLSVGRLSPEKNFGLLIHAFAGLGGAGQAARLVIVGDGPQRQALQKLIEELGLGARVRLLGAVANPLPYMRRSKLFVLPSLFEGFGNVLIEAMACGTPVVSTDCPVGPREILCNGTYGTLVPPDDMEALEKAVVAGLDGVGAADAGCARALEFSVERSADAYLGLARNLLAADERGRA